MRTLSFRLGKALSILHYMQAIGTTYVFGGKARSLAGSPPVWEKDGRVVDGVDCSGFHRYCMWRFGATDMPDGSAAQNDWYRAQGFQHTHFSAPGDYTVHMDARRVYAAFCRGNERDEEIGHVWLVYNDPHTRAWVTIESHGGHGPNSRPAKVNILTHIVTDVYDIGPLVL